MFLPRLCTTRRRPCLLACSRCYRRDYIRPTRLRFAIHAAFIRALLLLKAPAAYPVQRSKMPFETTHRVATAANSVFLTYRTSESCGGGPNIAVCTAASSLICSNCQEDSRMLLCRELHYCNCSITSVKRHRRQSRNALLAAVAAAAVVANGRRGRAQERGAQIAQASRQTRAARNLVAKP